jgi:hypothetical protein
MIGIYSITEPFLALELLSSLSLFAVLWIEPQECQTSVLALESPPQHPGVIFDCQNYYREVVVAYGV